MFVLGGARPPLIHSTIGLTFLVIFFFIWLNLLTEWLFTEEQKVPSRLGFVHTLKWDI